MKKRVLVILFSAVLLSACGAQEKTTTQRVEDQSTQPVASADAEVSNTPAKEEAVTVDLDGYAYVTMEDLAEYYPNMTGVKIYTVAEIGQTQDDRIQASTPGKYYYTSFYMDNPSKDYVGKTVCVCGTVADYTDFGMLGSSINVEKCRVVCTGDQANNYKKSSSDESLKEYFAVTAETAEVNGTRNMSKEDFASICDEVGSGNYEDILRNPDSYKDKYVKLSGEVFQTIEGWFDSYTIYVKDGKENIWATTYTYKEGESRVLEGDKITVYGTLDGTVNSETLAGKQVTMPYIEIKYLD